MISSRPPAHPLLLAGALLLGIVLALRHPLLPVWGMAAAGLTAALLVWWGHRRRSLVGAALMVAGSLYANLRLTVPIARSIGDQEQPLEAKLLVRVEGLPRLDADRLSFLARTEQGVGEIRPGLLLRLSWYRSIDQADMVIPGECLELGVRLRSSRGPANPAGWDPERSALSSGWSARGTVQSAASIACAAHWSLDHWRWQLANQIDQQLPAGSERATIKALALGDTREFEDSQWERLRRAGLSHLMAISGLHIGLVAGLGALLAGLCYRAFPTLCERLARPQAQALAALMLALGYAALAGFILPTQRAIVGLLAFLAARLLRRSLDSWSAYALALTAVLLIDPLAPLSAGFWLSFGAAGWLLYLFARGGRRTSWWRGLLLAQAILALGLWALTALWFQHGSWAGPAINLLAVPWVSLIVVPLTLLATAASAVLPAVLAQPLMDLAALSISPLWQLMESFDGWQISTATGAPTLLALGLASVGTLWLFAPHGVRWRAAALLCWLPLLWPRPLGLAHGELRVTVIDVGQGQAILLQTAAHHLLIDAGPGSPSGFDAGAALVVPALDQAGVRALDGLIISHGDSDHAGGWSAVVESFSVGFEKAQLAEPREGAGECQAGDRWQWDGVDFRILHPPEHFPYLGNESSCVLRIEDGWGAVLLVPGDIGQIIEQRLVREQRQAIDADVLIAPHHGSAGSSSSEFLAAVSPSLVIYSAGYGNRFSMPREQTVARVGAVGAQQLSTARSGQIVLHSDHGGTFTVRRLREEQRRPWRRPDLGPL